MATAIETRTLLPFSERERARWEALVQRSADADGCWRWAGARSRQYGEFNLKRDGTWRPARAHRVGYEMLIGPIPAGLTLDHHICDNKPCVNPAHLRPATQRENGLRNGSPPSLNARKTHCKRGHEFTPENTRIRTSGGRACRACRAQERSRASVKRPRPHPASPFLADGGRLPGSTSPSVDPRATGATL